MKVAHTSQIGAFGLELEGGGKEMIDAPMLKQVSSFSNHVNCSL
jgi:citrate lyase subunit beta-like protein